MQSQVSRSHFFYTWSTLSKMLSVLPPPPGYGTGMWMTHVTFSLVDIGIVSVGVVSAVLTFAVGADVSSTRKSINRNSYNTSTVLTLPSSLQWRPTRKMGPSPSWIP